MLPSLLARLPPATRFIGQCVCASGGTATKVDPRLTPPMLAAEARRQLVAGLVLHWARRRPGDTQADALAAELAQGQAAEAAQALLLVGETRRLIALLAQGGIRVVAMKGPLLARAYYGDYAARHAGDIDLLIAPSDVPAADRLLRDSGLRRNKPAKDLAPERLALYLRTQHEFGYVSDKASVELHWRYADAPELAPYAFDDLWRRAQTHDVAGTSIRTLSHRDTFVHLAIHGALDAWSRLKWIADLPRVLARLTAEDLAVMRTEARSFGYVRILALALAMADALADEPAWLADASDRIVRRMSGATGWTAAAALQDRRYMRALADNARIRKSFRYTQLIMPADFDRIALPDPLTPLLPYLAQGSRALRRLLG